jgi:hypothetical protein
MHTMTENDFIKSEIEIWGEDYILDLLDRGFTPVLLHTVNQVAKWSWLHTQTANPTTHNAFTSAISY